MTEIENITIETESKDNKTKAKVWKDGELLVEDGTIHGDVLHADQEDIQNLDLDHEIVKDSLAQDIAEDFENADVKSINDGHLSLDILVNPDGLDFEVVVEIWKHE